MKGSPPGFVKSFPEPLKSFDCFPAVVQVSPSGQEGVTVMSTVTDWPAARPLELPLRSLTRLPVVLVAGVPVPSTRNQVLPAGATTFVALTEEKVDGTVIFADPNVC